MLYLSISFYSCRFPCVALNYKQSISPKEMARDEKEVANLLQYMNKVYFQERNVFILEEVLKIFIVSPQIKRELGQRFLSRQVAYTRSIPPVHLRVVYIIIGDIQTDIVQ